MSHEDDFTRSSSPPCSVEEFAQELLPPVRVTHGPDWPEIRAFREAERARLLAARKAVSLRERQRRAAAVDGRIFARLDLTPYRVLGIYWPIRGELDLRVLARRHALGGGIVALPVVVEKHKPLEFWRWEPGAPTRPGFWKIPQPLERDVVRPDALIVPVVGFDAHGYRLGYGGGYYDRTLASLSPKPFCIGVGDAEAEIATIRPQPHDIPLDVIVTDREIRLLHAQAAAADGPRA